MKKLTAFILMVLIVTNIFAVFADAHNLEITKVNVSKDAVTVSGIWASNALVEVSSNGVGASGISDSEGNFSVSLPYSSDTAFDVTVSCANVSETVTIDGNIIDNIEINYDKTTSIAGIYGKFDNIGVATPYVIYSVHGGKSVDNIYTAENQTEIISGLTQSKTLKDGTFSYEYQIMNTNGIEHIYIACNENIEEYVLDTSVSISYVSSNMTKLMMLPQEYEEYNAESTSENFFNVRKELPDEMPLMQPVINIAEKEVYVSNAGSDTAGDGTAHSPYATLGKAISTLDNKKDTTVYLREGTYFINESVEINGFLGKLTIMPYNGEAVKFTNGISIQGSDFSLAASDNDRINPDMIGKVWEYDLTKSGVTSIDMRHNSILMLSDDYDTYNFARWPDGGTVGMKEYTAEDNEFGVIDAGPYVLASGDTDITQNRWVGKYGRDGFEFMIDNLHPFTWEKASDMFMCGSFYREFNNGISVEIGGFDADKQSVKAIDTLSSVGAGARYDEANAFYYFNVLEELNMKGDWCIDSDNLKLYVYPWTDIENSSYNLSIAENETILNITESANVTVSEIEFTNTSSVPVSIKNSQNITVQNCTFDNLRGNGVIIDNCKYSGVICSKFENVDLNSIKITNEYSVYNLSPDYNFVQNSIFYNSKPVSVGGVGVIVSHNMFSNMPQSAVTLHMARECFVEYNEFLRTPTVSEDMGAVYFAGFNQNLAHHIRYNYIHECRMDRTAPSSIYPDELAGYNYIYGNILENGAKIHMHGGSENTVYNNIIVNNEGTVGINDSENHIRYFEDDWETKMINKTGWFSYLYETYTDSTPFFDKIDKTAYQKRYPHYMEISELMKWRADEFRESGLPIQNNSIYNGRTDAYNSSRTVTYSNKDEVNLDIYLRAPRDNYIANNAFINSPGALSITDTGLLTAEISNNAEVVNPFENGYSDKSAYDEIRKTIPGFETIPFEKIGINKELSIESVRITYPQSDAVLDSASAVFKWTTDFAASEYTVEISDDVSFSDILYSCNSYKDVLELKNILPAGIYYVRVTAKAEGIKCFEQSIVSDVINFEIANIDFNESDTAYITNCELNQETSEISFNYYNTNAKESNHTIYAASYSDKNLIKISKTDMQNFDTVGKLSAKIDLNAVKIALFNWQNITLTPLSGKKVITLKTTE